MGILNHCRKWAREPLVHFLIIGAGLFLLDAWNGGPEEDDPYRIVVSASDVERLSALWQRQWQRPPTAEELQGAIDQHVREEIYFREEETDHLALGFTTISMGRKGHTAALRRHWEERPRLRGYLALVWRSPGTGR